MHFYQGDDKSRNRAINRRKQRSIGDNSQNALTKVATKRSDHGANKRRRKIAEISDQACTDQGGDTRLRLTAECSNQGTNKRCRQTAESSNQSANKTTNNHGMH
jgi:hypothetical protein